MNNVLAELSDEEAHVGLRCYTLCYLPSFYRLDNSIKLRYDILHKAPTFAATCHISTVYLHLLGHQHISLTDFLMPLTKLDSLTLFELSSCHNESFRTVLESKGHQLKCLHLTNVIGTIRVQDIVRTCRSLCKFTLGYVSASVSANDQKKQLEEPSDMPYLSNLKELTLANLSEKSCSREMLMSLLDSPYLEMIKLTSVEVMSNDHLIDVHQVCAPCKGNALTSLRSFHVEDCQR